jgi:hypothetical protein
VREAIKALLTLVLPLALLAVEVLSRLNWTNLPLAM